MKLLNSYSFMKGSSFSRFFRVNGLMLCRLESTSACNSHRSSGNTEMVGMRKDAAAAFSVRAFSKFGLLDRFKKLSSTIKKIDERSLLALYLYQSIDSIDFQEFYMFIEMPDTFNSWFVIMELHIWMLMSQLMNNEREGLKLRNRVVDALWYDVECRMGKLGESNRKTIKKQLFELSSRLPISLLVYDEGLLTNDMTLAGAIWYKFFDKQNVDPRKIEVLVKYVRYQIQHLSLLNLGDYNEVQKISKIWLPVTPHVQAVMSGN